jgi:hypothetical protein
VKFRFCETVNPPRFGVIVTLTDPPLLPAVSVIVAEAVFEVSATAAAVSVTVAGEGIVAGAVYVIAIPDGLVGAESVPHAVPVHPAPDKAHVTPLFCVSFATVAVNCAVAEVTTEALVAFRLNATGVGDCGVELDGELAQPVSSTASAASGVMTRKNLQQEDLDMSRKPRIGRCRVTFWCIPHTLGFVAEMM